VAESQPSPAPPPGHRVLFVFGREHHLGDLVAGTTTIRAYRVLHHPSRVAVLAPDRAYSRILERDPDIDDLLYAGDAELSDPQLKHGLSLPPADVVLDLSARSVLWLLHHRGPLSRRLGLLHTALLGTRGRIMAEAAGVPWPVDDRPVIALRAEDRGVAAQIPRPYVVLAPYVGRFHNRLMQALWQALKAWPMDRWQRLAALLRTDGYTVVTLGAGGEEAIPGTVPVIGRPIAEAAGVVERAAALITVESGLWYLACALGVPFVVVPYWPPRHADWIPAAAPPHRLLRRSTATPAAVVAAVQQIAAK